jgi:hypothetical protein
MVFDKDDLLLLLSWFEEIRKTFALAKALLSSHDANMLNASGPPPL